MESGKFLIYTASIVRPRLKSAVVKTYPVSSSRFAWLDSLHVSAEDPAEERRQDARVLERGREQACRRRPRRAASRTVFGRDQLLAGRGVAQGDRGARRRCGAFTHDGVVPRGPLCRHRARCVGGAASPVGDATMPAAPMGRLLARRAVVAGVATGSILG